MWFMMRRAVEIVRYGTYMSLHSAQTARKRRFLLVVAKCLETPGKVGAGITDWLLTAEEVGRILAAAWAERICRLFRPEATLRER